MRRGSSRYTVKDNYYDEDGFYEFRQSENNINMLADFYNECYDSKVMTLVSVFNQPLFIESFMGDKRFYYNSDEFMEGSQNTQVGIKSVQMNRKTFEFYKMDIEDGKEFEFAVAGFLKENSCIYYKTASEFCLDQYIVIPYPVKLWEVEPKNFEFEGILYFAMINCDLITDAGHEAFIEEVKRMSDKTGFTEFSIIGIDEFMIKNIPLIVFVWENINIAYFGAACVYLLWLSILYKISYVIINDKEKKDMKFISKKF